MNRPPPPPPPSKKGGAKMAHQQLPKPSAPKTQTTGPKASTKLQSPASSMPAPTANLAPPLSAPKAYFTQSAIACWRAEYLATMAMAVKAIGHNVRRLADDQCAKKKLVSQKAKTKAVSTPVKRQRVTGATHRLVPNRSAASAQRLLCSELSDHYVSHLKGFIGCAPKPLTRRRVATPSTQASPSTAAIGICERVYVFDVPPATGVANKNPSETNSTVNIANSSFRPDDVALFAPVKKNTPTNSSSSQQSPAESVTRLIMETQAMQRHLSIPSIPVDTEDARNKSTKVSGSLRLIANGRVRQGSLLDRRVLDRRLPTRTSSTENAVNRPKRNAAKNQKAARKKSDRNTK